MLVAATFYMAFGSVCYVAFGEATSDQILGTIMLPWRDPTDALE